MAYSRYLDGLVPGFRITLGSRCREVLAAAYVQPGHDLSYEHVTFAEHNGTIVGVIASYTAEHHRSSSGKVLTQAAGGCLLRRMGAAFLVSFLRRFGPDEGDSYVWALAVAEKLRGQGIGSILMDSAEEQARARGSARLSLDVETKNHGARRFYERRGMIIESAWPTIPFLPAAVVRMTKQI
jgi:ribosomal protein S18 acetylase RimI-like enzyme